MDKRNKFWRRPQMARLFNLNRSLGFPNVITLYLYVRKTTIKVKRGNFRKIAVLVI